MCVCVRACLSYSSDHQKSEFAKKEMSGAHCGGVVGGSRLSSLMDLARVVCFQPMSPARQRHLHLQCWPQDRAFVSTCFATGHQRASIIWQSPPKSVISKRSFTCSFCHLGFVKQFPRFGRKISAETSYSQLISATLG